VKWRRGHPEGDKGSEVENHQRDEPYGLVEKVTLRGGMPVHKYAYAFMRKFPPLWEIITCHA